MEIIYEPRGPAREYSPLALNLYTGCSHGCLYCYVPRCLRISREEFKKAKPREGVLDKLARDAAKLDGNQRPVLVSFTSDPYQPLEERLRLTRRTLGILGEAGLRTRVLTKNGALAERDFDLMARYGVEFGTTLTFIRDGDRRALEPKAGTIEERIEAIKTAHRLGIKTWVSVEPVIDPDQAIELVERLHRWVDYWHVGKLNHCKKFERRVDWTRFLRRALATLNVFGCAYRIKDALWAFADGETRGRFRRQSAEVSGAQALHRRR